MHAAVLLPRLARWPLLRWGSKVTQLCLFAFPPCPACSAVYILLPPTTPQVATLRGYPLYRVAATEVLADSRNGRWKAADHR